MASQNKTSHYELNQWEGTDSVLRADFNADNVKIDTAIAALASKLSTELANILLKCTPVIGYYFGDEVRDREIILGFKPSAVLILPFGGIERDGYDINMALATSTCNAQDATVTSRGFFVRGALNYAESTLNYKQYRNPYRYIAFR